MSGQDFLPDAVIRWAPTIDALDAATTKNIPHCPAPSSSEQEFNRFWYTVLTSLALKIEKDDTIPLYLTSPSRPTFSIKLLTKPDWDRPCWCDNLGIPFQIVLRNPSGVTKGDLIRGVRDYLYSEEGSQKRVIYRQRREGAGLEKLEIDVERAVIWNSSWHIIDNQEEEPDVTDVRFQGCSWKDPEIELYCCTMERIEEHKKEDEEELRRYADEVVG